MIYKLCSHLNIPVGPSAATISQRYTRMLSFVFGIFTLSCFPLSVLGERLLFRVDVTIPQTEGRTELEDIEYIRSTLKDLNSNGITVRYELKAFDNQHVLLILEVENSGDWPSFTSAMSSEGYKITVTALQTCNDYAKEIQVNDVYQPYSELNEFPVMRFYDMLFLYEQVTDGGDYLSLIETHLKDDSIAHSQGLGCDCYKSLSQMPFRFHYLCVNMTAEEEAVLDDRLVHERKAGLDYQWLFNIKQY